MRQPPPFRRVRAAIDDVQHTRVLRRRKRGVDGALGALRRAVAVYGGYGSGGGEGERVGPGAEDGVVVALFVGGVEEGCAVRGSTGLAGAEEGVVEGGGDERGERGGGGEAVEVGEGAEVVDGRFEGDDQEDDEEEEEGCWG